MNIPVLLASRTTLDRGEFLRAARFVTGRDIAKQVDKATFRSGTAEDMALLNEFNQRGLGRHIIQLGFLVGGTDEQIEDILQTCCGLPYIVSIRHEAWKAALITGSVDQWTKLVLDNSRSSGQLHVRQAFTKIYQLMCRNGLHHGFDGHKRQEGDNGTILLLPRPA